MRKIYLYALVHIAFLATLCLMSCRVTGVKKVESLPNIILFLVDDMGWQDTSVPFWNERTPFNSRYNTPNMERLAKEGMKFTQAYATPVCSPTRVSLMTGMNAARHRVTNWTLKKDEMKAMELNHKILEFPHWNVNGLSPVEQIPHTVHTETLPMKLKSEGYHTIHVGKAHFGAIGTPGEDPLNLGFDVNIAGHAAGAPGSYLGTEHFGNSKDSKDLWAVPGLKKYYGRDIFLTEALTLEAIEAMDSALVDQKPFFLYMSHYAVHTPIMADKRFFKHYLESGLDTIEAKYASLIEGMDKSLGDIMDKLDQRGIADNTVILFISDNGGLSAVARGGQKHTHNQPLSSGKGSMHEGGIRVPMLVKWPGIVHPETTNHDLVIIEDFFPTILEIAGSHKSNVIQKVDGISFMPQLKGEQGANDRAFIWHFPNEWGPTGPGIGAASAIRKEDWKLIYYHLDGRFELFNIAEDIGEEVNLIDDNTEKATELASELTSKLKEMDAQMPTNKQTGAVVKFPEI